ncbi:Tfp pilus assembly protein PilN [Neobacillus niacini]|uniref:PilN domain-containing protein n=1 Tax=Neobacillus driksii TaxID=3035913 RepID=UPI0027851C00|nr:PilN domain-containing protein [Neobacillus niacini]MDQ0975668.1 Tfp pilus assembly protein PilN [Neobacillus niacini]
MLVEINLLPQKEPRKKSFFIIVTAMAVIFLSLGTYYFLQIQTTKSDIANLDSQIKMTKDLAAIEEKNANKSESELSITLLKSAVEWANSYPIETIPVMQHLTGLLPERGFIQTFAYTEAGTVTISVQFDSAREAAYFLDNLNESEWIDDANLSSLTAKEQEENKEAVPSTATQGTNNQQTSTNVNNQSIVVTTDPNNPNSIIITPVDPNTTDAQDTTATAQQQPVDVLPRYIGQFEIKFNKETIKKLLNKGSEDEEGVTQS